MEPSLYDMFYRLESTYWWFLGTRKNRMAMIKGLPARGAKTLELACGTGGFLRDLRDAGFDTYGCDLSPKAVEYCAKRGLNALRADVNSIPFKYGSFDFIAVNDALSHKYIVDDKTVVKEMNLLLKDGGIALITDVACKGMFGRHDVAFGGAKRYSMREMLDMVRGAGFEILRYNYSNVTLFPLIYFIKKIKNVRGGGGEVDFEKCHPLVNALLRTIMYAEARLIRWVPFPFGVELMVVAKKKSEPGG